MSAKPPLRDVLVGTLAAALAAGGAWLTGETIATGSRVDRVEATSNVQLETIEKRLDRIESKLDDALKQWR